MKKAEQTQWAATYLVAAELTRRGYRVGWPMGNAPIKDLLVESPKGQRFEVDVKGGTYGPLVKSYWHPVQADRVKGQYLSSLFFIFVRVDPNPSNPCEFFILSHQELINLHKNLTLTLPSVTRNGKPYKEFAPGFRPSDLAPYRGNWQMLPN